MKLGIFTDVIVAQEAGRFFFLFFFYCHRLFPVFGHIFMQTRDWVSL